MTSKAKLVFIAFPGRVCMTTSNRVTLIDDPHREGFRFPFADPDGWFAGDFEIHSDQVFFNRAQAEFYSLELKEKALTDSIQKLKNERKQVRIALSALKKY